MSRDAIMQAYLGGRSCWVGCDWPTRFGTACLNLCALTSAQAMLMARATAGAEAADWRAAGRWLAEVEAAAREAEDEAGRAVHLAAQGHLEEAAERARAAVDLEGHYRPATVWRPLHDALTQELRPEPTHLDVALAP